VEPRGRDSLFDISTYPPLVKTKPEEKNRKFHNRTRTNKNQPRKGVLPEKTAFRSSENSKDASTPSSKLDAKVFGK
jgi:hypothetical protein